MSVMLRTTNHNAGKRALCASADDRRSSISIVIENHQDDKTNDRHYREPDHKFKHWLYPFLQGKSPQREVFNGEEGGDAQPQVALMPLPFFEKPPLFLAALEQQPVFQHKPNRRRDEPAAQDDFPRASGVMRTDRIQNPDRPDRRSQHLADFLSIPFIVIHRWRPQSIISYQSVINSILINVYRG